MNLPSRQVTIQGLILVLSFILFDPNLWAQTQYTFTKIFDDHGGTYTVIEDRNFAINNAGKVAFSARKLSGEAEIMVGDGTTTDVIEQVSAGYGYSMAINDQGKVLYQGNGGSIWPVIYVGDGASRTFIQGFEAQLYLPSPYDFFFLAGAQYGGGLNSLGTAVFTAQDNLGHFAVVATQGSGSAWGPPWPTYRVAGVESTNDTYPPYFFYVDRYPAINDSGTVAFGAEQVFADSTRRRAIFIDDGSSTHTLATDFVVTPSLNNVGTLAFKGSVNGVSGVWTCPQK